MEEYKLAICMIRVRDGVIAKYDKVCDLTMCKYCKNWNVCEDDNKNGICELYGTYTHDNFSCIDGEKG